MIKPEKRGLIAGFILFLIAFLIISRIELPSFVRYILVIVGIILTLKISYSRFKSRKIFFLTVIGMALTLCIFIVATFLEKNPNIFMPILISLAFLAAILSGFTAYKMFKELHDKYKK